MIPRRRIEPLLIIDNALEERRSAGNPILVGLVGAGYMGRGIALQILTSFPGIRLVAISNRTISGAERAFREASSNRPVRVGNLSEIESSIRSGQCAITDDPTLLCRAKGIDAVIEATGEVEFGSRVVLDAIGGGKHVILNNAELDATVGPILKVYADRAGLIISSVDGDEPGVAMNLLRYVKAIGFKPVLSGNLKGYYDPHRTPETQRGFADKYGQEPAKVTSFVDGTKLCMESTVLANATGYRVWRRGMLGPRCSHVREALTVFPLEQFLNRGVVDYLLGAEPGSGAFVVAHNDNPAKRKYLKYFKMGDGPFYLFYTPFHLPSFELPLTVARSVLFRDATVTPKGGPECEVIAVAKKELHPGEVLDGIGGFSCYGLIENYDECRKADLLPMGLSGGCRLKNRVLGDEAVMVGDVDFPNGRLCDQLWNEQNNYFISTNLTKQ
jgi:predicted homoserine dehydrogenase-like protein